MTIFLLIPLDNACKVFTKLIFTFHVRINTLKFILRMQQGDKCHSKQWLLDNISLFCFCSWEKKKVWVWVCYLKEGERGKGKSGGGEIGKFSESSYSKHLSYIRLATLPFFTFWIDFLFHFCVFQCFAFRQCDWIIPGWLFFWFLFKDVCHIF